MDKIKKCKRKMSCAGISMFKLYLHTLYQRASLVITPIVIEREPLPCHDKHVLPYLLVCTTCHTIRSQVHGINKQRKAKDGVSVNIIDFGVVCSGCNSPTVKMVDLRTHRVAGLSVNRMEEPKTITMCHGCGRSTVYEHVIGSRELCSTCYTAAQATVVPRRCLCGISFTTKNKVAVTFVALNKNKQTTLYALCEKHKRVIDHAIGPNHDVEYFEMLIKDKRCL
jgi:hypothetical protein